MSDEPDNLARRARTGAKSVAPGDRIGGQV